MEGELVFKEGKREGQKVQISGWDVQVETEGLKREVWPIGLVHPRTIILLFETPYTLKNKNS
jgi:hypothetical protein